MPVVLDPKDDDGALDGTAGKELLKPFPSEKMRRNPSVEGGGEREEHGSGAYRAD